MTCSKQNTEGNKSDTVADEIYIKFHFYKQK